MYPKRICIIVKRHSRFDFLNKLLCLLLNFFLYVYDSTEFLLSYSLTVSPVENLLGQLNFQTNSRFSLVDPLSCGNVTTFNGVKTTLEVPTVINYDFKSFLVCLRRFVKR